jgi:hypothetical protein
MKTAFGRNLASVGIILFLVACAGVPPPEDFTRSNPSARDVSNPVGPTTCDGRFLISFVPATSSCCHDESGDWFMAVRPGLEGWLVHHELGTPCSGTTDGTTVDPTATCSGQACYYGPCGGSRPKLYLPPGHVFKASSQTACGRQAGNLPGFPEPYVGQEAWPGLAGTCPFDACLGNIPAVDLTVNAIEDNATGHVKSIPKTLDLEGAGTTTELFTQPDATVVAKPASIHARAVFSGDCAATGAYGEDAECELNLAGGKKVTVTYECEPGRSCL